MTKHKINKILGTISNSFRLAMSAEKDLIVGGQAVVEGVMMRTPSAYAVSCRKADGEIVTMGEPLPKWSDRFRFIGLPILRGGASLIQSLMLGVKALNFSAQIFEQSESLQNNLSDLSHNSTNPNNGAVKDIKSSKRNGANSLLTVILALCINILIFIIAPLVITNAVFQFFGWAEQLNATGIELLKDYIWNARPHSWLAFNLFDGLIRILFFLIMIASLSRQKEIRRIFEYHGAEHKTVFAWEKGLQIEVSTAKIQPRRHPRCGTSFLMVVMIVSILLFSAVRFESMLLNLFVRILLLPVVAGISYEIIRLAASRPSSRVFRLMTSPGIMLQSITTKEPDDSQLEVAVTALRHSLSMEK
jgi:uncharacterized protein YqhQ